MYNTKEGKSCVIYIRVSSERQVKGYSLDGQKHYLAECAERRGMTVLDTYVEEGKSGKSIEGRTEFQRMLDDIQSGKVHTDYVLVFKLSRFGRNARDVLNSLEFIMKYGVHLMCVEDGLDSSTSMGKMMITILGAVAELERENIIAQSLLGREEKAKSGGWNGGFAPYGYRLVKGVDKSKGKLETVPEEKAVVQLVFDMFLNRNMGYTAISGYLNRNGYTRPPAKNAIRPSYGEWSSDHIKRMLSNPVYTRRVAWGKRRTEKVPGKDNEYRLVKQDEYILSEVISHEAFVSKEDFDKVQEIRQQRHRRTKTGKSSLFSGMVYCADCGAKMRYCTTNYFEKRQDHFVCANYRSNTGSCSAHFIRAVVLEELVWMHMRTVISYVSRYEDHFRAVMEQKLRLSSEAAIRGHKKRLAQAEKRLGELDRLFIRIYEDNVAGRITDEKFSMMSKTYEDEQAQLKEEIQTLQQEIEVQERQIENLEQFIQRVRKYEDLDELTPYALRELVKAIYIEAPDKSSGKRYQGIRISYDLVGFIPVEELLKQETA